MVDVDGQILQFIRNHPGMTGDEIRNANHLTISSAVLTELVKEGLIYMTETENRFRKYYAR